MAFLVSLLIFMLFNYGTCEENDVEIYQESIKRHQEIDNHNFDCGLTVQRLDNVQLACKKSNECIYYTNAIKYNDTCWKLSEVSTHFNCCNKYEAVIYKIKDENKSICHNIFSHSWCVFLTNLYNIIIAIAIWVLMALLRIPLLYVFKIFDITTSKLFKEKNKCLKCDDTYKFIHLDCEKMTRNRTDYNILYYMLIIILILFNPVYADDNKFNTYDHEGYTEFIIKDVEHEINEFYTKTNHIKIVVEKSYIQYDISYLHEVLEKTSDEIRDHNYSCDSKEDCLKSLNGDKKTFRSLKKNHDGLACIFSDAIVCASCLFKYKKHSKVYIVSDHRPVIILSVVINNNEKYNLTIDSYNDYIDDNFYIRSLNAIDNNYDLILIKNVTAYRGKICNVPALDCYGRHIYKNENSLAIYNPTIIDNNHHDTTVNLVKCTEDENLDLLRLNKIGVISKGFPLRVHEDRSFGHFSIGVRNKMLLNSKICEKKALVTGITTKGCHSCKYGFDVTVNYKLYNKCGKIECKTDIYKSDTYVDRGDTANLKLYSDDKNLMLECNNKKMNIILDDENLNSYYHSGLYTSSNSDIKDRLKNTFKLAIFDKLKMIVLIIIIILFVYMFTSIIFKIKEITKRSINKKIINSAYTVDMSMLRDLDD
ncbi:glycoprotein precursor [Arceuthobium sichuanense virus 1]|uniref:Glycoprotein n=1 Tax=Arceuthobium sichuanense-associated virus 1 TaxID=3070160 RepID=A0AA48SH83_9VIRU|nr:glycoprotein precursor [Arceuthobium sichuanense virus 1]DAZ87273.1 TPA_asm: glycoprotein precursor [Arceuthobium sichuanense-associated virus 1]